MRSQLSLFALMMSITSIVTALLLSAPLYAYRNAFFFKKRRFPLVVAEVYGLIGNFAVSTILTFSGLRPKQLGYEILWHLQALLLSYVNFLCFARLFYLKFDHKFNEDSLNEQWENLRTNHKESWFVKNKSTWGNIWYTSTRIGIPMTLALWLTRLFLEMRGKQSDEMLVFTSLFLVGVAVVVVWAMHGLPVESDKIFLRHELIHHIVWYIVSYCFFTTVRVGAWCPSPLPTPACYSRITTQNLIFLWYISIPTVFVVFLNKSSLKPKCPIESLANQWTDYVSTKHCFDLFARFLVLEFSTESLLFIVEYMQFKKDFKETICEAREDFGFKIELPEEVYESTKSDINYEFLERAKVIHEKYVQSTVAPLEINVSGKTRRKLEKIFGEDFTSSFWGRFNIKVKQDVTLRRVSSVVSDKVIAEIVDGFDECAVEVKHLLGDSFARFRLTCGDGVSA